MNAPPPGAVADQGETVDQENIARDRRATFEKFVGFGREFGPAYAALAVTRKLAGWVPARIDDRMLAIEGRRGVMGPAHKSWTQHSVTTNREVWSGWEWEGGGEEWTASEAWKASLVSDVLEPTMPTGGTILEIGPGAGRWTGDLHARAAQLILVDITDTTLELCRERLGDPANVQYVCTDGTGLRDVASDSVDAIWAFDAFVHIAPLDVASYLTDIRRVLAADGVAVIHHTGRRDPRGWRSPMSAALFANLARERGLVVERQFDTWAGGRYGVRAQGDVVTQLRRA
jgi:ubiquinone/menaquinone biosynthesis C-methylase UbiE